MTPLNQDLDKLVETCTKALAALAGLEASWRSGTPKEGVSEVDGWLWQ
jgi:hypothetical protein